MNQKEIHRHVNQSLAMKNRCWVAQHGNAVCEPGIRKFKLLSGRHAGKEVLYCQMHADGMAKEPKLAKEIEA